MLENYIFYIFRMYEFSHSLDPKRTWGAHCTMTDICYSSRGSRVHLRNGRQTQRRAGQDAGESGDAQEAARSGVGDFSARRADAGNAARLPAARDRQMMADHQGGRN